MASAKCFVFILFICLFNYVENTSLLCDANYCRTFVLETGCAATAIHCSINNATHSGIELPSPTICNCCDYCLRFFVQGEHCSVGGPGLGTTIGRCGDGLTCAVDKTDGETRCTRMTSACHTLQDEYDAREARGEVGAMEHRPMCDGKGRHAPIECIPAHTCFCQSEEGHRIFGESLYLGSNTIRHMQCGCSRFHEKIKKSLSSGLRLPVIGPRCTSDGNFNPVQCIDRTCYCVDPTTGLVQDGVKSINLDEHPITTLECYNRNLDLFPIYSEGKPPYNYTSPCLKDLKDKIELVEQSVKDGYNVDYGGGFTECYPDGTFGRSALTRTGSKVCIDDRGRQIGDYEALPGTDAFDKMDCKCAVTSYHMGASKEKPVCCKNGNFRPIQCRRGMCRCVDSDGRQTVQESASVNTLSCFTFDWKTC
ncbi:thyroglobulin-like [Anticarsia gemmatalis]|uniref:thyroglobulin-like n=1 Tax=Anticarsia gemmatalis TaxID=129554 RepID=UPI003F759009